ncbi:MAG: (d)CMP kinase [Psychrobacter sp.]|nr:(d)CMP kinase [Psychrobacter sp.]
MSADLGNGVTQGQNRHQYPVITIDGPSGAGKGTVSWRLAQSLGYQLLDSGALYRIVGLKAFEAGLLKDESNLEGPEEDKLAKLTETLNISFVPNITTGAVDILVNNELIGADIRNETIGGYASQVAVFPKVRLALLGLQQEMAQRSGLIADGRDMGTVVFPNADAKIYLTASSEARAHRRVSQLQQAGQTADYEAILATIEARDERDENRAASPSKPAEDALVLDSSILSAEQVYQAIKTHCQSKGICFGD